MKLNKLEKARLIIKKLWIVYREVHILDKYTTKELYWKNIELENQNKILKDKNIQLKNHIHELQKELRESKKKEWKFGTLIEWDTIKDSKIGVRGY